VCEVLSPSTVAVDRKRKLPIYARERVGHVWLVDPPARTLEVFRLVGDNWVLAAVHGEEDCVRIEPFQDLEFWT
jgi:Uma2 family endonuclease